MAWTSDDLAKVDAALATGAMSVKIGDMVVSYRNQSELFALRDKIARSLSPSTQTRRMTTQAVYDRGLGD